MYSATDYTFEDDENMNSVVQGVWETFPLYLNQRLGLSDTLLYLNNIHDYWYVINWTTNFR